MRKLLYMFSVNNPARIGSGEPARAVFLFMHEK